MLFTNLHVIAVMQRMLVKRTDIFGIRMGEHLGLSLRTNKSIKPNIKSTIHQHYVKTGHIPTTENFQIIDSAFEPTSINIKEAYYITNDKPVLNIQLEQPFLCLLQN